MNINGKNYFFSRQLLMERDRKLFQIENEHIFGLIRAFLFLFVFISYAFILLVKYLKQLNAYKIQKQILKKLQC